MAKPLNEFVTLAQRDRKTGPMPCRRLGLTDTYVERGWVMDVEKLGAPSSSVWRGDPHWWPVIQRAERFEEEP